MTGNEIIWATIKFLESNSSETSFVNVFQTIWKNYDVKIQRELRGVLLQTELIRLGQLHSEMQLTKKGYSVKEHDFRKGGIYYLPELDTQIPIKRSLEKKFTVFLGNKKEASFHGIDVNKFMTDNFIKPDPESRGTTYKNDDGVKFLVGLKKNGIIDYDDDALSHVNTWFVDDGPNPKIKRWFDTLHEPLYVRLVDNLKRQEQLTLQDSKIASITGDNDIGEDYLDIQDDILAFSKVIASKTFTPPLAIAVFGKWGTGKSFFLKKMMDQVYYLSDEQSADNIYCTGIAQIHFNAWSYLDANLWASIVSQIFESLNRYIDNDETAKNNLINIQKELNEKLIITYEEVKSIEGQKTRLSEHITELEDNRSHLTSQLDQKIKAIKENKLSEVLKKVNKEFHIANKIEAALKENESVGISIKELTKILPQDYWNNPSEAYKQMDSLHMFVKTFFKKSVVGWNIFWMALIIAIICLIPPLLEITTAWIRDFRVFVPTFKTLGIFITLAVPITQRIRSTYSYLQPKVAAFWKIRQDYEQEVKCAMFELDQKEKAIKLDIEKTRQEILALDHQMLQANATITNLNFKREHALATEALYSFIEKRCKSDEYRKHLGIISIIRNDFDVLSNLFLGHHLEIGANNFRKYFSRPLERIILYIDDLDRCPEDRVVEVLEAVNLLMAFPLFVVVVGVDPRWVKNALIKRYQFQFSLKENQSESGTIEQIDSSNYLEKIFQIPFHLKLANDGNIKHMIRTLSQSTKYIDSNNRIGVINIENQQIVIDNQITNQGNDKQSKSKRQPKEKRERLILSRSEIQSLEDMSVVLGNNPRAVKRFVNIYQIVRAHAGITYESRHEQREFLIMMFLIALYNGSFRQIAPNFVKYMYGYRKEYSTLAEFLQETRNAADNVVKLKTELNILLSDKPAYNTLQMVNMEAFKTHNAFIQRFSFDELEIPSIVQTNV